MHEHAATCSSARDRRGVAMLLVIVTLAMGTILASSYLASRDNSAAIGANTVSAAQARWSAHTALQYTLAVLETDSAWRTSHSKGVLIDNMAIGECTATVDLLDLTTMQPPTAETEYVQLHALARRNGVDYSTTMTAYVPIDGDDAADVDLSEFTVFSADRVELRDGSTITLWANVPINADRRVSLLLGTRATASSSVLVDPGVVAENARLYADDSASALLVADASSAPIDTEVLNDFIPLPDPPDHGLAAPPQAMLPLSVMAAFHLLPVDARHTAVHVLGGEVILGDGVTLTSDTTTQIEGAAKYIVDNGNVTLVTFGDFELRDSSIELRGKNASLTMYVGGRLTITDGYIGEERGDGSRDSDGSEEYIDPSRIRIYSIDTGAGPADWLFTSTSVVKGEVYAPNADMTIDQTSALYGRLASNSLVLRNSAAIYYDPMLNSHLGFTNPDSPLFNATGDILPVFQSLSSLSPMDLLNAASGEKLRVIAGDQTHDARDADGGSSDATASTPRTVAVEADVSASGPHHTEWEGDNVQQVRLTLRGLANAVRATDPWEFSGSDMMTQANNQAWIANTIDLAADDVEASQPDSARTRLSQVRVSLFGPMETSRMVPGARRLSIRRKVYRNMRALDPVREDA